MTEQDTSWAKRASRALHWYLPDPGCWLTRRDDSSWQGWLSSCGSRTTMSLDASWAPWESVQNASRAPFVRWFCGASTNAAFNEVDRHLLSSSVGQPAMAAAFLPEPVGDHPQMPMSRQQLLVHSVLAAHALRDGLKLPLGARVAVYMPNRPEVRAVARMHGMCMPRPATLELLLYSRAMMRPHSYD